MYNKMIVDSIKILCKEKGISISQLEADLDFELSSIDGWNSIDPSLDEIVDVANYFQVSLDDLIGYSFVQIIKNRNFVSECDEEMLFYTENYKTEK